MLLFLDVISPIPEFSIIEDNKLILNLKITKNQEEKLSDCIIQAYLKLENQLNLNKNLKKTSITIGPGSYTSLRVGSAFISGLSISKKIPIYPFAIQDIFKNLFYPKDNNNCGIYIESSNDQRFFCIPKENGNVEFLKIDSDDFMLPKKINRIFFNFKKINSNDNKLSQVKFSFKEQFLKNVINLKFSNNNIIKPVYISNNKILN